MVSAEVLINSLVLLKTQHGIKKELFVLYYVKNVQKLGLICSHCRVHLIAPSLACPSQTSAKTERLS